MQKHLGFTYGPVEQNHPLTHHPHGLHLHVAGLKFLFLLHLNQQFRLQYCHVYGVLAEGCHLVPIPDLKAPHP